MASPTANPDISAQNESKRQIIIPVYNEGEHILEVARALNASGAEYDQLNFVYDFDEDTTLPFIRQLETEDSRVCALKNNLGRGVLNALSSGFNASRPGPVIVVMGDNSDKLSLIPEMISLWENGAVVVCPSRYMKGGKQYGGGLVKSTLSRLAGRSLYWLGFPTSDPTNNFKLYDGEWLSGVTIESSGGFEIALELCYKAYKDRKKIVELPTEWRDRAHGESNFRLSAWLPKYLKWYFKAIALLLRRRLTH